MGKGQSNILQMKMLQLEECKAATLQGVLREAKLPVDLMYGSNPVDERTPSEYVQQLKSSLHDGYALVREHCKSEHKRQKAIYDEKIHGKPFDLGDNVWLHSPAIPRGQSKKL